MAFFLQDSSCEPTGWPIDAVQHSGNNCLICLDADREIQIFKSSSSSQKCPLKSIRACSRKKPTKKVTRKRMNKTKVPTFKSVQPVPPDPPALDMAATACPMPGPCNTSQGSFQPFQPDDTGDLDILSQMETIFSNATEQVYPVSGESVSESHDTCLDSIMDVDQDILDILEANPTLGGGSEFRSVSNSGSPDSGNCSEQPIDDTDVIESATDFDIDISEYLMGDLPDSPISPRSLDNIFQQLETPVSTSSFDNRCGGKISSDGSEIGPKSAPALLEPSTISFPEHKLPVPVDEPTNIFAVVFLFLAALFFRFFVL